MNLEQSLKELEEIVAKLEDNTINLDESIELFEKGIKLSRQCQKVLDSAEKKVSVLIKDENGSIIKKNYEESESNNGTEGNEI